MVLVSKTDGSEIKKTKINRKGKFKLNKITPGKYQINAEAEGKGSLPIDVVDNDIKDLIVIIKNSDDKKIDISENIAVITPEKTETVQALDTPLKTE